MTISRVNPGSWAANAELTTTQANGLDRNIGVLATDKTGDAITGTITLQGAFSLSGTLTQAGTATAFGSNWTWLESAAQQTINAPGGVNVTAGGVANVSGAMFRTVSGGRIQLADNDYPTFSASRQIVRMVDLASIVRLPSATTTWLPTVDGVQSRSLTPGTLVVPMPRHLLLNGATLSRVDLYYTPAATSVTTLPASFAGFAMTSRSVATGAPLTTRTTFTSVTDSYVDAGLYRNGQVKNVNVSFGPTTIDTSTKEYAINLTDESGVGAIAFSMFHAIKLTMNASSLAFA